MCKGALSSYRPIVLSSYPSYSIIHCACSRFMAGERQALGERRALRQWLAACLICPFTLPYMPVYMQHPPQHNTPHHTTPHLGCRCRHKRRVTANKAGQETSDRWRHDRRLTDVDMSTKDMSTKHMSNTNAHAHTQTQGHRRRRTGGLVEDGECYLVEDGET